MMKTSWVFLISFFLLVLFLQCDGSPQIRKYTEVRSGGGKFGQQERRDSSAPPFLQSMSGQFTPDTPEDKKLLDKLENNSSLVNGLKWETPQGWIEQLGRGVRLVTFLTATKLEVTLIAFPGVAGGLRSNLERWLKQVNLTLNQEELTGLITSSKIEKNDQGLKYLLVDFEDDKKIARKPHDETIMAGLIKFQDQTLFVKLKGEIATVKREQENMKNLLNSLAVKEY